MSLFTRLFPARPAKASWKGAAHTRQGRYKPTPATAPLGGPVRDLETLRRVSRHLVRNDALGRRAIDAVVRGVVGKGIEPRIVDEDGREVSEARGLVREYLRTPIIDAQGRCDIFGLQRLVMREVVEGGEAIIRRRRRRALDRLPLPLQVEVLPAEFIDETVDGRLANGNMAIGGIEFDARGRRVAFHLHTAHPHETYSYARSRFTLETVRVPVDDVIHVFRMDRAGQPRGVPWLAPVITRMQEYHEFSGAVLMRQKVAALFSVFITSEDEAKTAFEGEEPATDADDMLLKVLEPGIAQRLKPGENVQFPDLPSTEGASSTLMHFKRDVAAGLGLSYEVFAGDYSQGNFSSSRMGWIEHSRMITEVQQDLMIMQFLRPLSDWVMEAALPVFDTTGLRLKWTPPRREMIDPVRETNALVTQIDAGLLSRRTAAEEAGRDIVEIDQERAEDRKREETLDLLPTETTSGVRTEERITSDV